MSFYSVSERIVKRKKQKGTRFFVYWCHRLVIPSISLFDENIVQKIGHWFLSSMAECSLKSDKISFYKLSNDIAILVFESSKQYSNNARNKITFVRVDTFAILETFIIIARVVIGKLLPRAVTLHCAAYSRRETCCRCIICKRYYGALPILFFRSTVRVSFIRRDVIDTYRLTLSPTRVSFLEDTR